MYKKWKSLTREPYDASCPRSGKVELDRPTIFHVNEVEKLNCKTLRYFMSTKCKSSPGKLEVKNVKLGNSDKFHVRDIENVYLENFNKLHVHEV